MRSAKDVMAVPGASAEPALLLLHARPRALAPSREALAAAAGRVTDWDLFLRLAGRHGLIPLVAEADRVSGFLPEGVAGRVAQAWRANAARSLQHGMELLRVLDALAARGVTAVPFKGPLMAQVLLGDLSLRQFSDLDVLIPPHDLDRAVAAVDALGYVPFVAGDAGGRRHSLHSRHDMVFQLEGQQVFLELHWRLARRRDAFRLSTRRVFAAARPVSFLGTPVPFMDAVDLFTYLSVHASNHSWERLEHLRCLAEIVGGNPDTDWAGVCRRAGDLGALRRVHVAMLLLGWVAGVRWAERVWREAEADAAAVRAAREAVRGWVEASSSTGRISRASYRILGLDGTGPRLRYLLSLAFEPDEVDWAGLDLPHRLRPLYYVTRPLRLLGALGRKAPGRPAGTA